MPASNPVTMIVADDHPLIREGFQNMFKKIREVQILGYAANGQELVDAVRQLKPGVVIADVRMPVMDGIEATKKIKAEFPDTQIIALSSFDERGIVKDMIAAGATGYLLKNARVEEILEAIETTLEGRCYYCAEVSGRLTDIMNAKEEPQVVLTPREKQVLDLYCEGKSSAEIARLLFISVRTLEKYRASLMQKIGVKNVAGIVLWGKG